MPSKSKFIGRMDYYCRVASVGYDWARRWNVWDGGDADCSALVITCLQEAGFDTGDATYTGNLSSNLTARGWSRLAPDLSTAQPGDILLNDANHVAVVISGYGWGATMAQASIGETGDVYGNQPGDQTGWETNEVPISNYPWDCILRWEGEDMAEGWVNEDGKWWYRNADGTWPAADWKSIGGKWYYFDEGGWMVTGWLHWGGSWYYLQPETEATGTKFGYMVTGWVTWEGKRYYLGGDGAMVTGFRLVKGKWYCFDDSGALVKDDKRVTVNAKTGAIKIA